MKHCLTAFFSLALCVASVAQTSVSFSSYPAATSLSGSDNVIGYVSPGGSGTSRRFPLTTLWTGYFQGLADLRYQSLDADLTALAGTSAGSIPVKLSGGSWGQLTFSGATFNAVTGQVTITASGTGDMVKSTYDANSNNIADAAESVPFPGITSRPTTLAGYGITDAQGLDSDLTSIASLATTSFGRSLLTQADAAAARATLGVGTGSGDMLNSDNLASLANKATARTNLGVQIGLNVQAWDADLDAWAAKTAPAGAVADLSSVQTFTNKSIDAGQLTGSISVSRLPALTGGDATTSAGSGAITLGTTGVTATTYGSSSSVPVITVDAKGRITSATTAAISGGGGGTGNVVTVNDHAFSLIASAGKVVYLNGSTWALAKSDAQTTNHFIAVVQGVSGDNVTYVTGGEITGLSGLTAGTTYYLSDATAGAYTSTAPTTATSYLTPVFIAKSATVATVTPWTGDVSLAKTSNSDLATMAAGTVKANVSGSTAAPSDVPITGNSSLYAALTPTTNAQTGPYTLVATDKNKKITVNSASAAQVTVPLDASVSFPEGTQIEIQRLGAGAVTVGGSGVAFNAPNGLSILTQYDIGILEKTGTANTWNFYTASGAGSSATWDSIQSQGTDIASASTINLETATGNIVDVTGTTTITAVTLSQGHTRFVRFTGVLTLTNGASLILPSGANITTAAGDTAIFVGYASVVRVYGYQRASGAALVGGSGGGDASTNTSTSVDGEVALFSGTAGKTFKRATGSGIPKLTSGVQGIATPGTDYVAPGSQFGYIQLLSPDQVDGTGATRVTTEGATYGQATFSNSAAKAGNYVIYRFLVPPDHKNTVTWQGTLSIRLGGADTGSHYYEVSMADVTSSAGADAPTFSNPIAVQFSGDASGASGDIEISAATTLANWASNLTAGHMIVVKLARDGVNAADTSTTNSNVVNLTLRYGSTQ